LPAIFETHVHERNIEDDAVCLETRREGISIVLWACEYSETGSAAGLDRLVFDLSAAQYQRHAFGFTEHRIYGACITTNFINVYMSYWKDSGREQWKDRFLKIEHIAYFDLAKPHEAIQFFNIIRGVVEYNSGLKSALREGALAWARMAERQHNGSWNNGSWKAPLRGMDGPESDYGIVKDEDNKEERDKEREDADEGSMEDEVNDEDEESESIARSKQWIDDVTALGGLYFNPESL